MKGLKRAGRTSTRILLSVCLVGGVWASSVPVSTAEPIEEFRTLIAEVKESVREQNFALALRLLEQASDKLDELERRPILEEEALRWDLAQVNLNRADSMNNPSQRATFANESIKHWRAYVEFRQSLTPKQVEIFKQKPKSDRIQRAVRQMGNAFMARENIDDFSIRELFEEYRDLPPTFMSSKSIDLWMSWLFRCPQWKKVDDTSFASFSRKLKSGEPACKEDWFDFHDYLETWTKEQELAKDKKKRYERRLKDLAKALGNEG